MKTKYCTTCETDKPISEFRPSKTKKDGLQSKCIPCDKLYAKQYYEKNKARCVDRTRRNTKLFAAKFQKYKDDLCCVKCGEDENICLDFHHIDDKDHSIAKLAIQGNWDLLMEEIEKCIVLCANCHRKAHRYGLENI